MSARRNAIVAAAFGIAADAGMCHAYMSCSYIDTTGSNLTRICAAQEQCCGSTIITCCKADTPGSPWYVWLILGIGALAIAVITFVYHRIRHRNRMRNMIAARDEIDMTVQVTTTSNQPHWLGAVQQRSAGFGGRHPARPIFVQPPPGSVPPPLPGYPMAGLPPPYSSTQNMLLPPPPPYGFPPVNASYEPPKPIGDDKDDEEKAMTAAIQPMMPAYRMPSAKDDVDRAAAEIARHQLHRLPGPPPPQHPQQSQHHHPETTLHM